MTQRTPTLRLCCSSPPQVYAESLKRQAIDGQVGYHNEVAAGRSVLSLAGFLHAPSLNKREHIKRYRSYPLFLMDMRRLFSIISFTMAAVRSCGGAFFASAPRHYLSSKDIGSALETHHEHYSAQMKTSRLHIPKVSLLSRHEETSRAASSTSYLQQLSTTKKPLKPLVVCGPSGVGKGTIIARFMDAQKEQPLSGGIPRFRFSVSHTTRQPRPAEVNGVHYHFTTVEDMKKDIEDEKFLEYAEVHGNLYGTSFQSIFDVSSCNSNDDIDQQCLLDIDVKGVRSIKEFQSKQREISTTQQQNVSNNDISTMPTLDAKFLFIAPPSVDVLRERLVGRGTETPETLERRFQNAKAELEYGTVKGNFDAIVVNDDLDQACIDFEEAVKKMYVG